MVATASHGAVVFFVVGGPQIPPPDLARNWHSQRLAKRLKFLFSPMLHQSATCRPSVGQAIRLRSIPFRAISHRCSVFVRQLRDLAHADDALRSIHVENRIKYRVNDFLIIGNWNRGVPAERRADSFPRLNLPNHNLHLMLWRQRLEKHGGDCVALVRYQGPQPVRSCRMRRKPRGVFGLPRAVGQIQLRVIGPNARTLLNVRYGPIPRGKSLLKRAQRALYSGGNTEEIQIATFRYEDKVLRVSAGDEFIQQTWRHAKINGDRDYRYKDIVYGNCHDVLRRTARIEVCLYFLQYTLE
jgi:hypothetical protein